MNDHLEHASFLCNEHQHIVIGIVTPLEVVQSRLSYFKKFNNSFNLENSITS